MIRRQQFDFRCLTTLCYVYSNGTHIIFFQTQWWMSSNATRAMNFGGMHVCRALHDIAVEGLQSAKTQLEDEGLHSNMKQLEFWMLESSTWTFQCSKLSHDWILLIQFPCWVKEHGQVKSWTSCYTIQWDNTTDVLYCPSSSYMPSSEEHFHTSAEQMQL